MKVNFIVVGHEFNDPDSNLMVDGEFAPFMVFDIKAQDYIGKKFATREQTQIYVDMLNERGKQMKKRNRERFGALLHERLTELDIKEIPYQLIIDDGAAHPVLHHTPHCLVLLPYSDTPSNERFVNLSSVKSVEIEVLS